MKNITYLKSHINIFDAIIKYDLSSINQYLEQKEEINIKDHFGDTPLHTAVHTGFPEIVKLLLTNKTIDVNIPNSYNNAPLHFASTFIEKISIVELLIQAGANVNFQDKDGNTPLHQVVTFGHYATAQLLVQSGADISIKNDNNQTPLTLAIINKHDDIIHLLNTYQDYKDLSANIYPSNNISKKIKL